MILNCHLLQEKYEKLSETGDRPAAGPPFDGALEGYFAMVITAIWGSMPFSTVSVPPYRFTRSAG